MKFIGNLLALLGLALFAYTIVARFIGEKSVMGFSSLPLFGEGFTATGVFAGTACVLLLAVIALLKGKE